MPANVGDLLQVIDNQSYLGQQVLNVYYYRVAPVTGIADPYLDNLNTLWEDSVLDAVRSIQTDYILHVSREWRNLTNGTDLFVDSTVLPGSIPVAEALTTPSFTSAGFLLQRESLVTRNGYKRFAGLSEENIRGNTIIGLDTQIADIENQLAADLVAGLITLAEPIIVKRPITVPTGVYEFARIGSAQFRGLGTQNTRKAGRGV